MMDKKFVSSADRARFLQERFTTIRKVDLSFRAVNVALKFVVAFVLLCAAMEVTYLGPLVWMCFGYQVWMTALGYRGWHRDRQSTKKLIKDAELLQAVLKSIEKDEKETNI